MNSKLSNGQHDNYLINAYKTNKTITAMSKEINVSRLYVRKRLIDLGLIQKEKKVLKNKFEVFVETEYKDFYISNNGRLVNFNRNTEYKTRVNHNGYLYFTFQVNKKIYRKFQHVLLAKAFIPNNNVQQKWINHRDGNKTNNNILNLEWCTLAENNLHAFKTGLNKNYGEHNNFSKISKEQAISIIGKLNNGSKIDDISDEMGISKYIIKSIYTNKSWNNLKHLQKWKYTPREAPKKLNEEQVLTIIDLLNKNYSVKYIIDVLPYATSGNVQNIKTKKSYKHLKHLMNWEYKKNIQMTDKQAKEVIQYINDGYSNEDIVSKLNFVSISTLKRIRNKKKWTKFSHLMNW